MHIPLERRELSRMREMFHTVAPRYDLITRLFSYGMDMGWKRRGVGLADLPTLPRILDLASGTGDFSRLVSDVRPGAVTIATDLTHRMLGLARSAGVETSVCADAMRLPFPDQSFDAVFIGYGLRNFPGLEDALAEIRRVMKPGGMLVSLDFFLPESEFLQSLYLAYLYAQGAFWGLLLHGQPSVYTYIPKSLRAFVSIRELNRLLDVAGFADVRWQGFILGGIALHWARR
jgi:demethylmenaquinone methyltransferase / 2-methoxy-6-polyprenyl-1,4-benzoquinol methylase